MKIELNDSLFKCAIPILRQIESHGYEAYFVGGCVRDTLLAKSIHDIDIATSARPEEIEAIFPITFDVGKEHGTIIVLNNQIPYEITTFRVEGKYSDFRHPDSVDFVRDLEEDTLRRDFTINALALDSQGKLFDYHAGQKDLTNQIIRAVGKPLERFEEDALRTIRAIRFASQLGFTIEQSTFEAIQTATPLLLNIAIERIRIELTKYFQGEFFVQCSDLFVSSGIADNVSLLVNLDVAKAMHFMKDTVKDLVGPLDERFAWYLFVKGLGLQGTQMTHFLRRWTHSNQFITAVQSFEALDDIVRNQQLTAWEVYAYDIDIIKILEIFYKKTMNDEQFLSETIRQQLPIEHKKDLVVNGKLLMNWLKLEKGNAALGNLINQVEYKVVMGQLANNEEAIREFALNHYHH